MFKVHVKATDETHVINLNSTRCTIGPLTDPPLDPPVDVAIDDDLPTDFLIEVSLEEGSWALRNATEHPAARINGETFTESPFSPEDEFSINSTLLVFEQVEEEPEEEEEPLQEAAGVSAETLQDFDIDSELQKINEIFESSEQAAEEGVGSSDLLSDEALEAFMQEAVDFEPEPEPKQETEPPEPVKEEVAEPAPPPVAEEQIPPIEEAAPQKQEEEIPQEQEEPILQAATEPETSGEEELAVSFAEEPVDSELSKAIATSSDLSEQSEKSLHDRYQELPLEQRFEKQKAESTDEWSKLEVTEEEKKEGSSTELIDDAAIEDENVFSVERPKANQTAMLAAVIVMLTASLLFLGTFQLLRSRNTYFERLAAEGIADMSMAFLQARWKGDLPPSGDVQDPVFIREHLGQVIGKGYITEESIAYDGPVLRDVYKIKVHHDPDLSRFVILAEPHSTFANWILPRKTFVIASSGMEIHRIDDALDWAALLGKGTDLSEIETQEIINLEENAPTIRLSSLDQGALSHGFSMPRELDYRQTKGATKVYNAPRYYRFGEELLASLSEAATNPLNEKFAQAVQKQMVRFAPLGTLVLYTPEGAEKGELYQKELINRWETHDMLVGQVTLDSRSHKVAYTSLIHIDSLGPEQEDEAMAQGESSAPTGAPVNPLVDTTDPLFTTLTELREQRTMALSEISDELITLVRENNALPYPPFHREHPHLIQRYIATNTQMKSKIQGVLEALHEDFIARNGTEGEAFFLATVEATRLADYLPAELKRKLSRGDHPLELEVPKGRSHNEPIDITLARIGNVKDLAELAVEVEQISNWLHQNDGTVDQSDWNAVRQQLRGHTLSKLSEFLLTPDPTRTEAFFTNQNRVRLTQILSDAQVSEQQEREFYLQEFDHLLRKYRKTRTAEATDVEVQLGEINRQLSGESIPSMTQQDLRNKRQELQKQLTGLERRADQYEKNLASLTLDIPHSDHTIQQESSARMGQQMLLQAQGLIPSESRDQQVKEAMTLLQGGLQDNRGLWKEVLEGNRLLVESPEKQLKELIYSGLGLVPQKSTMPRQIRALLSDYLAAISHLSTIDDKQRYRAQWPHFAQTQKERLAEILKLTAKMHQLANQTNTSLSLYLERLEEFQKNYNKAQSEGFFASSRRYHRNMTLRLKKKITYLKKLRGELNTSVANLDQLSTNIEQLGRQQLAHLESETLIDAQFAANLREMVVTTSFPDPLSSSVISSVDRAIGMQIDPIPTPN